MGLLMGNTSVIKRRIIDRKLEIIENGLYDAFIEQHFPGTRVINTNGTNLRIIENRFETLRNRLYYVLIINGTKKFAIDDGINISSGGFPDYGIQITNGIFNNIGHDNDRNLWIWNIQKEMIYYEYYRKSLFEILSNYPVHSLMLNGNINLTNKEIMKFFLKNVIWLCKILYVEYIGISCININEDGNMLYYIIKKLYKHLKNNIVLIGLRIKSTTGILLNTSQLNHYIDVIKNELGDPNNVLNFMGFEVSFARDEWRIDAYYEENRNNFDIRNRSIIARHNSYKTYHNRERNVLSKMIKLFDDEYKKRKFMWNMYVYGGKSSLFYKKSVSVHVMKSMLKYMYMEKNQYSNKNWCLTM